MDSAEEMKRSTCAEGNWRNLFRCLSQEKAKKMRNDEFCVQEVRRAVDLLQQEEEIGLRVLDVQDIDHVLTCLRQMLQFWSKGEQSASNPWSSNCMRLATLLANGLQVPSKHCSDHITRCSKLLGFTLARSTIMGTEDTISNLLLSVVRLLELYSDEFIGTWSDVNLCKMILYCVQSVADYVHQVANNSSFKPKQDINVNQLEECCRSCLLRVSIVSRAMTAIENVKHRTKLMVYIVEAVFIWSNVAESSAFDNKIIAQTRNNLVLSLFESPCIAAISRILDMILRQLCFQEKSHFENALAMCHHLHCLVKSIITHWNSLEFSITAEEDERVLLMCKMIKLYLDVEPLRKNARLFSAVTECQVLIHCGLSNLCSHELDQQCSFGEIKWRLISDTCRVMCVLSESDESLTLDHLTSFHEFIESTEIVSANEAFFHFYITILDREVLQCSLEKQNKMRCVTSHILEKLIGHRKDLECFVFRLITATLKRCHSCTSQQPSLNILMFLLCCQCLDIYAGHLSWMNLLENLPSLKLLANLFLRMSATELPLNAGETFFCAVLKFKKVLIELFTTNTNETIPADKVSSAFDVLGNFFAILLHCCSQIGILKIVDEIKLEFLHDALILCDVLNIGWSDKLLIVDMCAECVLHTLSERKISLPINGSKKSFEWSQDLVNRSIFLSDQSIRPHLQFNCRQEGIACLLQKYEKLCCAFQKINNSGFVENLCDCIQYVYLGSNEFQSYFEYIKLHAQSIALWSSETMVDNDSKRIIRSLKQLISNLFTRNHTVRKENLSIGCFDKLRVLSIFKLLMLLLQWSVNVRFSIADETNEAERAFAESDSSDDEDIIPSLVIVRLAFSLCKHILSWKSSDCALLDFDGDCRLLFHYLGLHGLVGDQLVLLQVIEESVSNTADNGKKGIARFLALMRELKYSLDVWLCFNGLDGYGSQNYSLDSVEIDNCVSIKLSEYLSYSIDTFRASMDEKKQFDVNREIGKWECKAEEVFQLLREENLYNVASQVALLQSKLLVLVTGHHETALKWAKFALGILKSGHNLTSDDASVKRVCPASTPLEMEGMLLVADLHEMTGSLDRCLSYLAEAKALSNCTASVYQRAVYSSHALRIWYRLNSKRIELEFNAVMSLKNEIRYEHETQFAVLLTKKLSFAQSESSERCFDKLLSALLFIGSCLGYYTLDACQANSETLHFDDLRFRLLECSWKTLDNSKKILASKDASPARTFLSVQQSFVCSLPFKLRRHIDKVLAPRKSTHQTSAIYFSGVSNRLKLKASRALLASCVNGMPATKYSFFDAVRCLRRRYAVDILRGHPHIEESSGKVLGDYDANSQDTSLLAKYAFVLGAASCGTAAETSLENKSDLARNRSSHMCAASREVEGACLGSDADLLRLMNLLAGSSPNTTKESQITCFVTLEHSSKMVVIGRNDPTTAFPHVVAIPCYDELTTLVEEWEEVIECNRLQLSKTRDATCIKRWTTAAKQEWWSERARLDERIQTFMDRVQGCLGVWRCLLVPASLGDMEDNASVVQHFSKTLVELSATISQAESRSKRGRSQKDEFERRMNDRGCIQCLMGWFRLITLSGVLSSSEQIESMFLVLRAHCKECCDQANYKLEEVINESYLRELANQLWDVLFDQRNDAGVGKPSGCVESEFDETEYRKEIEKLRVMDLKKVLKKEDLACSGKKNELIERLVEHKRQEASSGIILAVEGGNHELCSREGHTVLILDELLQNIPFESIPLLRHKDCSRVPGLAVLINLLKVQTEHLELNAISAENGKKSLSLSNCWYSIDPDANLLETRSTMTEFIEPYATRWGWHGFVGEKPPAHLLRAYHEKSDLFLYCGHGSGDRLFDKENRLRKLRCPAAMLWGCSSGALSCNGIHDPLGTSLLYLLGGAPFVIGNLWDVTDKDIDKLSVHCMSSVFDSILGTDGSGDESGSISRHLAVSRGVCKLKAAVGFAPVMYGLPVKANC